MPIRRHERFGHLEDPYSVGYRDPTICPTCKLIYHNKHWFWDDELLQQLEDKAKKGEIEIYHRDCPACRRIKEHYPMGIVRVRGEFWKVHRGEIFNLIRNEERRAQKVNPLERIIKMEESKGELIIETTSGVLAHRIGNVLEKSYKGKSRYHLSEDQKLLRVEWER